MKPRHQYLARGTFAFPQDEEFPDYARVTEAAMYWMDASDLREHVGAHSYSKLLRLVRKCFEDAMVQLAPPPGAGPGTSSGSGASGRLAASGPNADTSRGRCARLLWVCSSHAGALVGCMWTAGRVCVLQLRVRDPYIRMRVYA